MAEVAQLIKHVASNGYTRGRLHVLEGDMPDSTLSGERMFETEASFGNVSVAGASGAVMVAVPMDETETDSSAEKIRAARMQGYEGDPCGECGNLTLVRNGTCLKCVTCGSTSGCS